MDECADLVNGPQRQPTNVRTAVSDGSAERPQPVGANRSTSATGRRPLGGGGEPAGG
jgi:hypothetical protein